jgi:hypothetical protein
MPGSLGWSQGLWQRNAKDKSLLFFAHFAHFAPLRETGLLTRAQNRPPLK